MARRKRRWGRLPEETAREVIRLAAAGRSTAQIRDQLDLDFTVVTRVTGPYGGVYPRQRAASGLRLSADERVTIAVELARGCSMRAIAAKLNRCASTVSREVKANGGRAGYQPRQAHCRARTLARRPKPSKLAHNPELLAAVVADLRRLWSPEQIARRLRAAHPDRPEMHVSHETIYQSLFVQGRGELRRELHRCLRTGRAARKPRGRDHQPGARITGMIMLSERPAEADDRAVPGHWEGDLILGANHSAIGTLVERHTRFVMLLHLPGDHSAEAVRTAMTEQITTLPAALRRTLTWDQGPEMAQHARFTVDTGIPVYFCDPHSPWQRGSNENTNGLLRQYFPKGVDLRRFDAHAVQAAADSLNGRPRQTLNWMTPSEKLNEVLGAMTT